MTVCNDIVICDYCGEPAEIVTGGVIFPHRRELYRRSFWRCVPCDARVGCHPGTIAPLGSLADAALRRARQRAHAAFDPLWRREARFRRHGKSRARIEGYAWLGAQLGIPPADCHIGMFDEATCQRVVEICLNAKLGGTRENA